MARAGSAVRAEGEGVRPRGVHILFSVIWEPLEGLNSSFLKKFF